MSLSFSHGLDVEIRLRAQSSLFMLARESRLSLTMLSSENFSHVVRNMELFVCLFFCFVCVCVFFFVFIVFAFSFLSFSVFFFE